MVKGYRVSKKKIAILSNVTVDLIKQKLKREYEVYIPEGYDTWVQEVLNPNSGLYADVQDAIVILLDGTEARAWKNREEAEEKFLLWKQTASALHANKRSVPLFISTIDVRENRIKALSERKYALELENEWYQYIQKLAETEQNVYVFDVADAIREVGRNQFYSDKMWYMSNMPYSREGLNTIVKELKRILNSTFSSRKKLIVLDLDNTLWGGVIGEDGIDGIELSDHKEGQRFYDFQRQFLEMQRRGILLAVNSKNNPEDAQKAITEHPDMLLRDEQFVAKKINWENKGANLKAIEEELNLTEGSLMFIDDNPMEREIVQGMCSDVFVPEFPDDTTSLLTFAEDLYFDYCRPLKILSEDLQKTQMYQTEAKRKQELSTSLNLDDYIQKLEISIDIHRMCPDELERVTQLCNKTNQFNVTTKRYTKAEIQELSDNSENAVYVVYARDKYGESGLISVIILISEHKEIKIDTFLMSCRVMGRKLENVILNEISAFYQGKMEKMKASYIPTAKNAPVRELYDRLGFELISESAEEKLYEKNLRDYKKESFEIYKNITFEG